jgi:hypothetical protein
MKYVETPHAMKSDTIRLDVCIPVREILKIDKKKAIRSLNEQKLTYFSVAGDFEYNFVCVHRHQYSSRQDGMYG